MTEGICDFALQLPGPERKTGYNYHTTDLTHDKTGVTIHTAEYDLPEDDKVLYNALFSGRAASWHFTITRANVITPSVIFQHYPVNAVTWHCGYPGNLWTVGIECEGYAPNKISGPQYDLLVKLLQWLRQDRGWRAEWQRAWIDRCGRNCEAALWEHNEIMDGYTACQVFSRGMIDTEQLIADLKEEPMEIKDDFAGLRAEEMEWMWGPEEAHHLTQLRQMQILAAIRHSKHESPEAEMARWKALSGAYDAEVASIRKAQERCRVHGRPG